MNAGPAWKSQSERGTPWLLTLIIRIALVAGRPLTRALLVPIVAYFFASAGAARRASRAYLARVLGGPVSIRDQLRHLYAFAACTLDRVYLLSGRGTHFDLRLHDIDGAIAALHRGQPALVLVAHVGSYDVLRIAGAQQAALKFQIVMDRAHGRMLVDALATLNPSLDGEIIDRGGEVPLALRIRDALSDGCVVGLMADRLVGDDAGVTVNFLGEPARLPATPWLLGAALNVPVFACFGLYRGGRRYDLYFEPMPVAAAPNRAGRTAVAAAAAQHYADRLALHLQTAPYNWFNFYDFWAAPSTGRPQ